VPINVKDKDWKTVTITGNVVLIIINNGEEKPMLCKGKRDLVVQKLESKAKSLFERR